MSVPLVVAVELRFLGEKVITDVILKLGFIVCNDWITADLHKGIFVRKNCSAPRYSEEALAMFTSNEYEEESGLFLYNAT